MAEYDNIAKEYTSTEDDRLERTYVIDPNFLDAVGNVKGKAILELACGGGKFSKKFMEEGAKEFVGVDLSEEMIKIAKDKAIQDGLNIKYLVGDVAKLGKMGEFDLVVAAFLLHYSKTKEELLNMCKNIFLNLKEGGKFIAINTNPMNKISFWDDPEFGVKVEGPKNLQEGDELIYRLSHNGKEYCSFSTYYWSKETYEECFREVGFKGVKWIPLSVPEEARKKYPQTNWNKITDNPRLTIVELIK